MQRVISPSNPRLREALPLIASSRERRKSGRCVLEGAHLVGVYRERFGVPPSVIITDESLARDDVREANAHIPPGQVIVVPGRLLAEHSSVPAEVGILAVVPTPRGEASLDATLTLAL